MCKQQQKPIAHSNN